MDNRIIESQDCHVTNPTSGRGENEPGILVWKFVAMAILFCLATLSCKMFHRTFVIFSDRQGFQVGSLSHMINVKASGYHELPEFPEVAPDPSVRDVEVRTITLKKKGEGNLLNPFTPDNVKSKIDRFFKITNWVQLRNEQHYSKVLRLSLGRLGDHFLCFFTLNLCLPE